MLKSKLYEISNSTAIANGLLTINGTGAATKIIINPHWDLDLSSNYQLSIDDGAFTDASGQNAAVSFAPVNFSTVTPGVHTNGTVATEAVASQMMLNTGDLAASKSWMDIQDIGNIQLKMTQLGDLSTGAYALVMKNYATTPGGPTGDGSDGIVVHDTNVGFSNFGNNDVLYFDSQVNNLTIQKFDAGYSNVGPLPAAITGVLAGQTAMQEGTAIGQQVGQAFVALGFEGNTTNTYYGAVYTLPGTPGFANDWHSQSAPVIMG